MKSLDSAIRRSLTPIGLAVGMLLAQSAAAATLDLNFNYRLTPASGDLGVTIATAHFEDVITSNGLSGINLRLTNVASNIIPGQNGTSYISGLLLAFDYDDADLPGIVIDQFSGDTAHSDRWEPQEDVATVDGLTFTSELGFPKSETPSTTGWRLAVGEFADIQFLNDTAEGLDPDGVLPHALTVASIVDSIRGSSVDINIPAITAAVKVRSTLNLTGGELIESVPTVVVGASPAPVPVPGALPLFVSAILAGFGFNRRRSK